MVRRIGFTLNIFNIVILPLDLLNERKRVYEGTHFNVNLSYVIKRKVRASISEEQRPNSSIYFMTTKPVTFKSIYASKWSYNLIITFGMLLISGGIVFIVKAIIGGFGESHYTTLVYAAGNTNDNLFFFECRSCQLLL